MSSNKILSVRYLDDRTRVKAEKQAKQHGFNGNVSAMIFVMVAEEKSLGPCQTGIVKSFHPVPEEMANVNEFDAASAAVDTDSVPVEIWRAEIDAALVPVDAAMEST